MKNPGNWPARLLACLIFSATLGAGSGFAQGPVPGTTALPAHLIVHLYYGDRSRLDQLVQRYDVFEYADHEAGYVDALLSPFEYNELLQSGYRIEVDAEQTAAANRAPESGIGPQAGIPSFPCYRTVEETYATMNQIVADHPDIASLVDIGDSWEKTMAGGNPGYDIFALVLSTKARPGPKPKFLLVAEFHARELVTSETALRFAEELAAGYGVDPDITWMLDYYEVHIVPVVNPDGRKKAEAGQLWRKNTDSNDGCSGSFGTDLNRNCSFKWGLAGSSGNPCDETYHGPAVFSEPESQVIRDYARSLFPDQRGTNDTDAAPATATGAIVSLHSYGQLVLYAWGWTNTPPPNATALKTLGGKLGFFNRYTVEPTIDLYPVSGELNDWAYGELGVAAYTIEMGTAFFQTCASFESGIYPSNRPALYYACKACRQPYLSPFGPDVLYAATVPGTNDHLVAQAVSGRSSGYSPLPLATNISAARYTVDNPSWISGTPTFAMSAMDGSFNSTNELLTATLDTTGWSPGRHTVFVEARTGAGTWGLPTATFVTITPPPPALIASLEDGQIVLRWPSASNTVYTLQYAQGLGAPFTTLASNLVAQPPTNAYFDTIDDADARFYRLKIQP